jgi:hypothetical protein
MWLQYPATGAVVVVAAARLVANYQDHPCDEPADRKYDQ